MGRKYGKGSRIVGEMMRKIIQFMIPCIIFIALCLPFAMVEKDIEIAAVIEALKPYATENMKEQDIKVIKSSYQLKDSDMDAYFSYGPISYINVDEITLIQQSDEAKRKRIYENALAHIDKLKKNFEGYGVEQVKLLKKAKVVEKGSYVICVVADDADTIIASFHDVFK